MQPGCSIIDSYGSIGCSHSRAYELFAESIISAKFLSQRCENLNQARKQTCSGAKDVSMGKEPGNIGLRGIFYLKTNKKAPFALG